MNQDDIGKKIVVIISEHRGETETLTGILSQIFNEDCFEVTDKWGNKSEWSRRNIKGFKFKGET